MLKIRVAGRFEIINKYQWYQKIPGLVIFLTIEVINVNEDRVIYFSTPINLVELSFFTVHVPSTHSCFIARRHRGENYNRIVLPSVQTTGTVTSLTGTFG